MYSVIFRRCFGNVLFKNCGNDISIRRFGQWRNPRAHDIASISCTFVIILFDQEKRSGSHRGRPTAPHVWLARVVYCWIIFISELYGWLVFAGVYNNSALKSAHVTRSVFGFSSVGCGSRPLQCGARWITARVPLACLPACAEVRVQRKCKACALSCADDTAARALASLCSCVWYIMFLGLWKCDKV